jgi:hypothetical protein
VELDETEPDFVPVRTRCSCSVESANLTTLHICYELFQIWKFGIRRFVTRRGSLRPFALGSRVVKESSFSSVGRQFCFPRALFCRRSSQREFQRVPRSRVNPRRPSLG